MALPLMGNLPNLVTVIYWVAVTCAGPLPTCERPIVFEKLFTSQGACENEMKDYRQQARHRKSMRKQLRLKKKHRWLP